MKFKEILKSLALSFAISLALTALVTLLWNLLVRKTGAVIDWKTSFRIAIIIGLFIPFSRSRQK